MSTTFKPLADRVLIEPAAAEQVTASGIIIPDTAKEKPLKGTVIAVGPGKKDEPMEVKVDNIVIYGQYSGTEIKIDGKDYLIMKQGDIYGIIGLSGAGKSTLIRCLARLIQPSSGKVSFHNSDISHLKGGNLRNFRLKIGMIFQHFNLLSSRTVAGNITYPLEIAGVSKPNQNKRVDELLGLVGLSSKKDVSSSRNLKMRLGFPFLNIDEKTRLPRWFF